MSIHRNNDIKKILFICIHNSARSQMAEAFINNYGKKKFFAESAGLEPGKLNLFAVKAMMEIGIDISANRTKSVFKTSKTNKTFDYIITVCDPDAADKCPIFPGKAIRLHWGFKDPSSFIGTDDEKLAFTRKIRDDIKTKIMEFISNS